MMEDTDALAGGMADTAPAADAAPGGETTAPASTETTAAGSQGTIADGNVSEKPVVAPADWPEDWRIKLAGEDKSYLKTLDRFNSPADLAKAYRDAQARLSAGNLKAALPENPTAEELQTWRAENGVPDSPDKYDVNLGDGFVWSDDDKPLLDDFAAYAHQANMPASQVKQVLGWYASMQERQQVALEEADDRFHQESEDNLRQEWGNEFRRNTNAIANLLDVHATPEVKTDILLARLPNGRRLGDDPRALKVLASMAREANPEYTVVPSPGFQNFEGELEALQKKVGTQEYWRDPKMQARYRELLEAKSAREGKGRAA